MLRHFLAPFLLAGLSACGGTSDPVIPTATTQVDVRDNVFVQATIRAGTPTPITWTWRGTAGHNVTFEDGQGSSATQASGTHSRAFSTAGTYRYRCTIHSSSFTSGMVSSVTID